MQDIVTESDQFRYISYCSVADVLIDFGFTAGYRHLVLNLLIARLIFLFFVCLLNLLSIEEFIPLLRERMNVLNPYVRQFLVGWITVLDSVPDIDMLGFLPDFLDGKLSHGLYLSMYFPFFFWLEIDI